MGEKCGIKFLVFRTFFRLQYIFHMPIFIEFLITASLYRNLEIELLKVYLLTTWLIDKAIDSASGSVCVGVGLDVASVPVLRVS